MHDLSQPNFPKDTDLNFTTLDVRYCGACSPAAGVGAAYCR